MYPNVLDGTVLGLMSRKHKKVCEYKLKDCAIPSGNGSGPGKARGRTLVEVARWECSDRRTAKAGISTDCRGPGPHFVTLEIIVF